jgi:hypothetical protein
MLRPAFEAPLSAAATLFCILPMYATLDEFKYDLDCEKSIWHTRSFIFNFRCAFTSLNDKTDLCQQDGALFKAVYFGQE